MLYENYLLTGKDRKLMNLSDALGSRSANVRQAIPMFSRRLNQGGNGPARKLPGISPESEINQISLTVRDSEPLEYKVRLTIVTSGTSNQS